MPPQIKISEGQLKRVCRMYRSAQDAARALGVSRKTINILCIKYGVEKRWENGARSRDGGK